MNGREALEDLRKVLDKVYEIDIKYWFTDYDELEQALERLHQIESVEGSEVMETLDKIYNEPFDILKLDNAPLSAVPQFANFSKLVYNYIQQQTQREREYEELKSKVKRYLEINEDNGSLDELLRLVKELKQLVGESDE